MGMRAKGSGFNLPEQTVGSVVLANGWQPYDANKLPELGYGKSLDVVTNLELEALAKTANGGPIKRPSDGKEVTSVIFVQNVGQNSEEKGHLPYHSGIGDMVAINVTPYSPATLMAKLNEIGGKHGIGRLDLVENRFTLLVHRLELTAAFIFKDSQGLLWTPTITLRVYVPPLKCKIDGVHFAFTT